MTSIITNDRPGCWVFKTGGLRLEFATLQDAQRYAASLRNPRSAVTQREIANEVEAIGPRVRTISGGAR